MRLVGASDEEIRNWTGREFCLFRRGEPNRILSSENAALHGLLGIDLGGLREVRCVIQAKALRDSARAYEQGAEGKVFGVDLHLLSNGSHIERRENVFLLKVFSEQVIQNDEDGRNRLARAEYLCSPDVNFHLKLGRLPSGIDTDLFAGAPILAFTHHLGAPERNRNGEQFVCYLMKNAGVSRGVTTARDKPSVQTWSEFKKSALLPPHHRILLARDLASAVDMLHCKKIQHCDLSPENVLIVRPANPTESPRLALIDFDCFHSVDPPVLPLPIHKQFLFYLKGAPNGLPWADLRQIFQQNGYFVAPDATFMEVPLSETAKTAYCVRTTLPAPTIRHRNYLLEEGSKQQCAVSLLGAPGHENYRAPVDLLETTDTPICYDNFALGMMIHELLCCLVEGPDDSPSIPQTFIDRLARKRPPDADKFYRYTRLFLHDRILELLARVFQADSSRWPKPEDWMQTLDNALVYLACPGPMRAARLWAKPKSTCLWPLTKTYGLKTGEFFCSAPHESAKRFLADLQRQRDNEQLGVPREPEFCAACGSQFRLHARLSK